EGQTAFYGKVRLRTLAHQGSDPDSSNLASGGKLMAQEGKPLRAPPRIIRSSQKDEREANETVDAGDYRFGGAPACLQRVLALPDSRRAYRCGAAGGRAERSLDAGFRTHPCVGSKSGPGTDRCRCLRCSAASKEASVPNRRVCVGGQPWLEVCRYRRARRSRDEVSQAVPQDGRNGRAARSPFNRAHIGSIGEFA